MPVLYPDKQKATLPDGRVRHWLADRAKGTTMAALLENVIPPDGTVPPHCHDVEELIVCLAGRGEWLIDGEAFDFYPGCVAHIPPGKVHSLRNTGGAPLHQLAFLADAQPRMYWAGKEY